MRAAKILLSVWALVSFMLVVGHVLNLPDYPVRGWFAAARVTKGVTFNISGEPSGAGWAARWGRNRPPDPRPHQIISEVEVRIQHEIRPEGLVEITITGDSEGDVDAVIETLKHDFNRTYGAASAPGGEPFQKSRGRFHSLFEPGRQSYFWRQRYFALLAANVLLMSAALLAIVRSPRKSASPI